MVLLRAASVLRGKYPSGFLNVRRLASEAGQVSAKSVLAEILLISGMQLRRTGLYDFHVENGAKMVPFAGFSMPLSYGNVGQGKVPLLYHFCGT